MFQGGYRKLKKKNKKHGQKVVKKNQKSMMSYTAYFTSGRPSPIVSNTGSYIICKSRRASFLVNVQGIMSLFWNSVSIMKLLGRGRRYSGNAAEFSGDFCNTDTSSQEKR